MAPGGSCQPLRLPQPWLLTSRILRFCVPCSYTEHKVTQVIGSLESTQGQGNPLGLLSLLLGPILSHLVAGLPGSLSPAQHTNVGTHAMGPRHRSWQRADRRPLRHLGLSVPTGCSVRLLMLGTSLNTQRPQREGNAAAIWAWGSPGGQAGVP